MAIVALKLEDLDDIVETLTAVHNHGASFGVTINTLYAQTGNGVPFAIQYRADADEYVVSEVD